MQVNRGNEETGYEAEDHENDFMGALPGVVPEHEEGLFVQQEDQEEEEREEEPADSPLPGEGEQDGFPVDAGKSGKGKGRCKKKVAARLNFSSRHRNPLGKGRRGVMDPDDIPLKKKTSRACCCEGRERR